MYPVLAAVGDITTSINLRTDPIKIVAIKDESHFQIQRQINKKTGQSGLGFIHVSLHLTHDNLQQRIHSSEITHTSLAHRARPNRSHCSAAIDV